MEADHGAFSARLDEVDGECRVILRGDIDLASVPELFRALQEGDRRSRGDLTVVLDDVTLIDSAGLGVLARLAAAGVRMRLVGARGVVDRALQISGLDTTPNITIVTD